MSRSNHSRTKKTKYNGRDYRDRVGHPNEHIKTPIKKRAEQSKKRIQKTVELNLHETIW